MQASIDSAKQHADNIKALEEKYETIMLTVLMAEHPRLGNASSIPTDVATLIAAQLHKDVSE